ncbi:MAG TPA: undecaprenyldiphospho-muramoylpentapeptide beta-N-acetylglucosaminyltransferase [Clostridia bacterium]|nr:undecaprenyldiphospho-muramoylpentapeptide beta-N-acetylglucosaminyltransferase [Clostridia bacterium]
MRVILTGGGTGGHIYPAIAIGQALLKKNPYCKILYLGGQKGLENKLVPESGFPMKTLEVVGWERKISPQALGAIWKAGKAYFMARKIIRDFQPDLIIGTGGYVCLPVVMAGAHWGCPTILHEQNAFPGLTNRLLARWAKAILLTFPEARNYFSAVFHDKIIVTGLPVRSLILETVKEQGLKYFNFSPTKRTLLTLGGSRGAESINQAMVSVCSHFYGDSRLQIIHSTGENGYQEFRENLLARGIDLANNGNIMSIPYLKQMEYALACADLCVARSGATFLAEMTAKGIPGILVPYPYAAEGHQEHNARALAKQGAAVVILDQELNGEVLIKQLEDILFNQEKLEKMASQSKQAGKPEALATIISVLEKYL